ncbi:hypothetical protein IWQ49_006417 [Labrenzia sp. EL_126]|nr:hypothetical protein [Labrenzia sp. EL_126]
MNQVVEIDHPMSVETGTVAMLAAAEIDQQISTAKRYPRSLQNFRQEALAMATLNEDVAQECFYAIPRDGKMVEGPSARFAEIVISAWGNCRSGARIVNEGQEFVTAQGVCHDLQRNVAITYEVQRRITGKSGKRYSPDMIGVTANAASSIALRNAILKVVPKAFWNDIYLAARKTVMGDFKTLGTRRVNAIKEFLAYGVAEEQIFEVLDVKGIEDIGLEHLVTLGGILTAIKEGDTTPEQAFGTNSKDKPAAPPAPPPTEQKSEPQAKQQPASQSSPPATQAAPGAAEKAAPPPPDPGAAKPEEENRFFLDGSGKVWDRTNDNQVPSQFVTTVGDHGFTIGDGYSRWLDMKAEKEQQEAPLLQNAAPPPPSAPPEETDVPLEPDEFIKFMDGRMKEAGSEDDVIAIWHDMSPEDILDFPPDLERANEVYERHRAGFGGNR